MAVCKMRYKRGLPLGQVKWYVYLLYVLWQAVLELLQGVARVKRVAQG